MDTLPREIFSNVVKDLALPDAISLEKAGLPAHLSAEVRGHVFDLVSDACITEARERVDAMVRAMQASRARARLAAEYEDSEEERWFPGLDGEMPCESEASDWSDGEF